MIYQIEIKVVDGAQVIQSAKVYETQFPLQTLKVIGAEIVSEPFLYGKLMREYAYWDEVVKWGSYFVECDTMSSACRQIESLIST